ncbi:hypothetical protein C471_11816 [Halorubrum saccharovorum DSM 1137]|uniref:Uncharacterized protein n=1 Tax=Halorubrum saccharovorum DSM 1137 TaxID=1227484 RepID=M0DSW4_9EURY|nr:UPF0146 family protein [Halorubrum saccharovorum]ELZ37787.1 hypothetical protein C471_11816 [Halorubrum saccharovorum DSM 1137]
MVSPSRRALTDELAEHDRLVEIGVGDRPAVAQALAERGCRVVAVDVDPGDRTRAAARATRDEASDGSLRVRRGDVLALAKGTGESELGPIGDADDRGAVGAIGEIDAIDAVYACNLPAEIQRPTVGLADRLDAVCVFTTLGFEEPVVPVRRRSVGGTALYVARDDDFGERSIAPE